MDSITDILLEREKNTLSQYACLTANTKGRQFPYIPCENRTEYQRDRDRIIHSQSFRRLMNKTQVFLAPVGDHYRTRLTHTLEVSQIARTVARALRLNEDLVEAAALGHDLGHTPFGHAGEFALQEYCLPSFTHYKQSLRVVDKIERDGKGLNLTWEVRDAIVNHAGDNEASTLEGKIIKYADRIAYINHDIDDACRAGILTEDDIPTEIRNVLGRSHSQRINTMVNSLINNSYDKPYLKMDPETDGAMQELRDFLFVNVYHNPIAKSQETKSKMLIAQLFDYYKSKPDEMPESFKKYIDEDGVDVCICDYLSCMTDRYAIETFRNLYIPEVWRGRQ